jgi:hypothetical protein
VALANAGKNDIMKGLAAQPGADMTARLLLALTALYVDKTTHSTEERQQYVELARRLIDRVDATTRATVADMLHGHAGAPAELRQHLGVPVEVAAREVARVPLHMPIAAEPVAAQRVAPLSAPVAEAPPEDLATLAEAFFTATVTERRRLLTLIPADPDIAGVPPDDADGFFAALDAAALQGRIGEFIREFERSLAMPRTLCERIVNDPSGEPMVVVAKAANIPIAVLQRLLLLVNPAVSHSVQRVFDLTDLYHGLDRGVAVRLAGLWRAGAKPSPADVAEPGPAPRDRSIASLRARFGALSERIQSQGVSSRPDPKSAGRRDLRSR